MGMHVKSPSKLRSWWRPRFSLRLLFVAVTLFAIGSAYVGSYVSISTRGRYEPIVIGLGGVKWYDWAPEGFVEEYEWNTSKARFYYPLWQMDRRFWHPPLDGQEGSSFAVNEVPPEEIGRVYRAWGALRVRPPEE